MSHVDVPQGGTATHRVKIRSAGSLVDPDGQSVVPTINTPASGANAPTVPASASRVATGVYDTVITAQGTSTLSSDLDAGEHWEIEYSFAVGGVTPAVGSRRFTFEVVQAAVISETGAFITAADARTGFFERREHQTGKTGTTITLGRRDGETIISLKKNGVALTQVASSPSTNEFSFVKPATITLGDAATATDEYDIHVGVYLPDEDIEFHIDEMHAIILGKLEPVYSLPFSSTPPLLAKVERWAVQWALAAQLEGHPVFRMPDDTRDVYLRRWMECKEILMGLIDGDITLRDENGDEIPRLDIFTDDEALISFESSAEDNNEFFVHF